MFRFTVLVNGLDIDGRVRGCVVGGMPTITADSADDALDYAAERLTVEGATVEVHASTPGRRPFSVHYSGGRSALDWSGYLSTGNPLPA